ncbi:MAG TPA: hypothetical protein VFC32_00630 [Pseudolabrys sp.]|nr:hypothetical protein [Pseudolabrys sp.]
MAVHPALHSWRDELPDAFVRGLAVLCGLSVLSVFCAWVFQSPKTIKVITPTHQSEWSEIERPFPAFALSIPEAADVPSGYAIQRHTDGGGRKDILSLGEPDSASSYLVVEIYRPGSEIGRFTGAQAEIAATAAALGPVALRNAEEPLVSKFGPLSIVAFETSNGTPRHCLGFVRAYDDPRLQLSGWFCQGGALSIERSTLACALDRLTLLSAGSEPKVGALFAQAELNRSFCGQRDPILASTPKYKLLWKALATRPEPRRIGR